MFHGILNIPDILNEKSFFDLSSETLIDLMNENERSLYWITKTLLTRKKEEDLIWQVKCLKKLIGFKQSGTSNLLFTPLQNNVLRNIIREFTKGKIGEAQLYGLLYLAIDTGFSLPDELVKRLVVAHQSYHWLPLLTEKQRIYCFEELLKNADTDKEYIGLIEFLSLNKEAAQNEVKQIIEVLLKKYPDFFEGTRSKNSANNSDNLIVLKVLPVLILHLNDERHHEVLRIILPKLNDPDARVREAALKIITVCLPYFKEREYQVLFNSIRLKLDDKKTIVRLAAQSATTKCMPYFECSMRTANNLFPELNSSKSTEESNIVKEMTQFNDEMQISTAIFQKLSDNDWIIREEIIKIITTSIPYLNDTRPQEVINLVLPKLSYDNWKVRKGVLNIVAACISHLKESIHQAILEAVLPQLNDTHWKIREVTVKIIAACIPYLIDTKRQETLTSILLNLNDHNWIVRDAILQTMHLFIPSLNASHHRQILNLILPNLHDKDWSNRYVILQAMNLFIPYICDENHQQVLDAILIKLNDTNSIIRGMALQLIIILTPHLNRKYHQQILDEILPKLNDKNSYVCNMARKAITKFMLRLNNEQRQRVLMVMLSRLEDHYLISEAELQDVALCIPYISNEWYEKVCTTILSLINDRDWKVSRAAMQALIVCIPYVNNKWCEEIPNVILPKLNDEQWELCEEALKTILACTLYFENESNDSLYEQLNNYLCENSFIVWCDELYNDVRI